MLPLIYVGLISFISSFTISHSFTREYLRDNFEGELIEKKKDSKVKFNTNIRFKVIPPISNISTNTINKLWYKNEDYEEFKNNFLKLKKYNSI
tara:strand:- start:543 stop:821 length:279 start_codon:yes stop_codon:yes gene_type:complete